MNLIVLVKLTVDVNQLGVDDGGGPDLARAPWRISDVDEYALEAAVRLRERHGGRVLGLTLREETAAPREVVLRALAMGLDGLCVVDDQGAPARSPLRTATALAGAIRRLEREQLGAPSDLVLAGEASADGGHAQVGPRVAEALGWPVLTHVVRLALAPGRVEAERLLEDVVERVECDLPAVVTIAMEADRPRLPTVLQVMGAGRKPVATVPADVPASGNEPTPRRVFAPVSGRRREVVPGETAREKAEALLRRLREDGVLPR